MKKPPRDYEDEIRRLRDDLSRTRSAIIDLMPVQLSDVLSAYWHCATSDDVYAWTRWAVAKLIAAAVPLTVEPKGAILQAQRRAYCPLCSAGSSGQTPGYTLPLGMERHLTGSHRLRQCDVFWSALELGWDNVRRESERHGRSRPAFTREPPPWNEAPAPRAEPPLPPATPATPARPVGSQPLAKVFQWTGKRLDDPK